MKSTPTEKAERQNRPARQSRLTLNERLALISLIDEGMRLGHDDSPIVSDLFSDLWDLVDTTIKGSTIDHLKPEESTRGFQVFEINAETGENLGRLHMLYLKKPLPCYYLVYVEVAHPFRNKGLGNRILEEFRKLAIEKSTVAILDNIIPKDDPTYDIYLKLDWRPIRDVLGPSAADPDSVYMIFVPPSLEGRDLREPLRKLVYHLKRRRPVIDMRDNELMVRRTIEEFKEIYRALLTYFETAGGNGQTESLKRFMFTRFVTRLLGFRRRIGQLLGYTGGESLEQIVLDPAVRNLPVQSYAPRDLAANPSFVTGDRELWLRLPEALKKHPARMIESLPNYRRPSLVSWMEANGVLSSDTLTIGDLLDLGFDPTRLKEISLNGEDYIFERLQPRMLQEVEKKREVLQRWASEFAGERVNRASLKTNPPLLIIRDRGNCYVLRRKLEGIHWDEAVEQLRGGSGLSALNQSLGIDRIVVSTVRKATEALNARLKQEDESLIDRFTFFVSWNLEANQPRLAVDSSGASLESVWVA